MHQINVFTIENIKAMVEELRFRVVDDGLNMHDQITICVARRENHYDALYHKDLFQNSLEEMARIDMGYWNLMYFMKIRKSGVLDNPKML